MGNRHFMRQLHGVCDEGEMVACCCMFCAGGVGGGIRGFSSSRDCDIGDYGRSREIVGRNQESNPNNHYQGNMRYQNSDDDQIYHSNPRHHEDQYRQQHGLPPLPRNNTSVVPVAGCVDDGNYENHFPSAVADAEIYIPSAPPLVSATSITERTAPVAKFAEVTNGNTTVNLPYEFVQRGCQNSVIMTHGLGAKNPKVKTFENDEWIQNVIIPAVRNTNLNYCAYTARGHGDSTGWEATGEIDGDQFTWKRLGHDMLGVALYLNIPSFVSAGSSQGSATALYAAIYDPSRVKAVIMIRPPSAWNRHPEKKLESAEKCKAHHPNELNYLCLKGTAYSDLPPLDSPVYSSVMQKVLILTVEGDKAHPVSTAEELSKRIPHATLHIACKDTDAVRDWPQIICDFLGQL